MQNFSKKYYGSWSFFQHSYELWLSEDMPNYENERFVRCLYYKQDFSITFFQIFSSYEKLLQYSSSCITYNCTKSVLSLRQVCFWYPLLKRSTNHNQLIIICQPQLLLDVLVKKTNAIKNWWPIVIFWKFYNYYAVP